MCITQTYKQFKVYTKAIGVVDVQCISWVTNWITSNIHWSHLSLTSVFYLLFIFPISSLRVCLQSLTENVVHMCDSFVNFGNTWYRMPVTVNHAPESNVLITYLRYSQSTSWISKREFVYTAPPDQQRGGPARRTMQGSSPPPAPRTRSTPPFSSKRNRLPSLSWFLRPSILKGLLRYFMYIMTICTFCCVYF